jgi:bacteriocin-like protein
MNDDTKKQNPEVKEDAKPELTETDLKQVTGGGLHGEGQNGPGPGWIEIE